MTLNTEMSEKALNQQSPTGPLQLEYLPDDIENLHSVVIAGLGVMITGFRNDGLVVMNTSLELHNFIRLRFDVNQTFIGGIKGDHSMGGTGEFHVNETATDMLFGGVGNNI